MISYIMLFILTLLSGLVPIVNVQIAFAYTVVATNANPWISMLIINLSYTVMAGFLRYFGDYLSEKWNRADKFLGFVFNFVSRFTKNPEKAWLIIWLINCFFWFLPGQPLYMISKRFIKSNTMFYFVVFSFGYLYFVCLYNLLLYAGETIDFEQIKQYEKVISEFLNIKNN